jgi:hypothetical protein
MAVKVIGKRMSRLEVATNLILRQLFHGKKLMFPVRTKELTCLASAVQLN